MFKSLSKLWHLGFIRFSYIQHRRLKSKGKKLRCKPGTRLVKNGSDQYICISTKCCWSSFITGNSLCVLTKSKKAMEINPRNPIMEELRKRAYADKNDKSVNGLVLLLFDTSLLTSGFILEDPDTFGNKIHRMLKLGLSLEEDSADGDVDMPSLEEADGLADSKMEEVD